MEGTQNMGRTTRLLAAVSAAVVAMVIAIPSAQASTPKTECKTVLDNGLDTVAKVCMDVWYTVNINGTTGVAVPDIRIRLVDPGEFEANALVCHNLRLWNDKDTVVWAKYAPDCNLTRATPSITFHPNRSMPQSNTANEGFTFDVNLNNAPDMDNVHIGMQEVS